MPNKLKVVHLITQLELGGAQRNTLYTLSHLSLRKFEPVLISGAGGLLDGEAQASGRPTYFIPILVRPIAPIRDVAAVIAIYRLLRRLRPHVIHTHSSKAGILGRVAAYFAGVPLIIHTFHGFGFTPTQPAWVRRFYIVLERVCAVLSTHLVYVSEENKKLAQTEKIGTTKPCSVIRSGIEFKDPASSDKVRQELRIPSTAWVVTSVANFKPQKNPRDAVQVAIDLVTRDPQIVVLFAGDGEAREGLETAVKAKGLQERIRFLGWRQDIHDLLLGSQAFLLTSLWEGLPRSVVEAFAAQRPVVAYAVDGVREVVNDGKSGFLVTPGDTALAVEKLLWLKSHPAEATAMGRAGYERVRLEFDIQGMVDQQEALYEAAFAAVPLREHYESQWASTAPRA